MSFFFRCRWAGALGLLAVALAAARPTQAQVAPPAWEHAAAISITPGSFSEVSATAADAAGSVYVVGSFYGTIHVGATTLTHVAGRDGFVAKWSDATKSFVWARALGGPSNDYVRAVAVSSAGVYIAGEFQATIAVGSTTLTTAGNVDGFVAKLQDDGPSGSFGWAQRLGGPQAEFVNAVAVRGTSVFVGGNFAATADFGATTLTSAGQLDGFIAKLLDDGPSGTFSWAQPLGGPDTDEVKALVTDETGVYVAGHFRATSHFGSFILTGAGTNSLYASTLYVARLLDRGSSATFAWVQAAGGPTNSYAQALAVSGTSLYLAGSFEQASSFGPLVLHGAAAGAAFVAKLTDTGTSGTWAWATSMGGASGAAATAVAVQGTQVYVAGPYVGPATFGSTTLDCAGQYDVFVAQLTDAGPSASLAWAQRAGSTATELATGLALASSGRVYVGGGFNMATQFGSIALTGQADNQVGFIAALGATPLASTNVLANSSLQAYPSPAHGTATVQLPADAGPGPVTLTLLDALGRAARSHTARLASGSRHAELSLAGLAPGVYALRVAVSGRVGTTRLVVE